MDRCRFCPAAADVTNLLDNSLKHGRPGATVVVTLRQEATLTSLRVEDDGMGFPAELLPQIFNRYVKGPSSQGHGLGLAFVAAVVRSHDGSVSASNRPNGGARITIELPRSILSKEAR